MATSQRDQTFARSAGEMTPDQIRDVLRKKFPPDQLSDEEIVLKAAHAHDRLLAAAGKHTQSAKEVLGLSKADDDLGFEPDWVTMYRPAEDNTNQPDRQNGQEEGKH